MVVVDLGEDLILDELGTAPFPREVEFIISALEAGPRPQVDRHKVKRARYRVRGMLRLFSDPPDSREHLLYTRNISQVGMAFVSPKPVTLSHGGVLRIPSPQGKVVKIACTVLRCRELAGGWFEGAVYFNLEQPLFQAENMPGGPEADEPAAGEEDYF